MLPRDAVPARFKDGELHGTMLAADTPAGRLLGRHLDALFDLVGTLSLEEVESALAAFVSSGDVVKYRLDLRETEQSALREYIAAA